MAGICLRANTLGRCLPYNLCSTGNTLKLAVTVMKFTVSVLVNFITVVEGDLVYLDTEEFSANCTNPSITSSHAPLFTYNDIPLVNVTINELYGANVTTLPSDEGHIRALLEIIGQKNSTLNDSTVTCLVDSAVIWRLRLIINGKFQVYIDVEQKYNDKLW